MPVYRTPDGRIVEEKTEVTPPGVKPRDGRSNPDETTVTRRSGSAPPAESPNRTGSRYDETTVVRRPGSGTVSARTAHGRDERTRLAGGIPGTGARETEDKDTDPVTGWLVVIKGPGKGRDVRIGNGRNALGRDAQNRVALPFGDTLISREKHLWITYDHLHQAFSVAPGGDSANVAYLNDEPIDTRLPLEDGATIAIGKTTLRFVAFCGSRFRWSDAG